jgi:RHS repeat-associated protein
MAAAGGITYTYDADGNVRQTGDGRQYCFDAENRLTKIINGMQTTTFKYDGLGRRIEKNENGAITKYIYSGENILEVYSGNNVYPSVRVVHGLGTDEPLVLDRDTTNPPDGIIDESLFYVVDHLGSVVKLIRIDGSGNPVEAQSYTYDSFGRIVQQTPVPGDPNYVNQPFSYTGREWDTVAGLYYYRARYYDPQVGRFLSEDPIGFDGGINFYTYVRNNPVNRTDPLGLYDWGPLGGTCCNHSGGDEWALVGDGQWKRLRSGECTGFFEDCDGMTCGGGFYYIRNFEKGDCRTPCHDNPRAAPRRWTPSGGGKGGLSPTQRGSRETDQPPGYRYHPCGC